VITVPQGLSWQIARRLERTNHSNAHQPSRGGQGGSGNQGQEDATDDGTFHSSKEAASTLDATTEGQYDGLGKGLFEPW